MTLIEVVLAVLILAFALIPIADHLGKSTTGTLEETSEADAMQFACDNMDEILMMRDFDEVDDISETYYPLGKKTEVKLTVEVFPLSITSMASFTVPDIEYHSPCNESDSLNRGVETKTAAEMDGKISEDKCLGYMQLDEEKLRGGTGTLAELKDIKLTVKWRTKGGSEEAYNRHPIVLYSRKARL